MADDRLKPLLRQGIWTNCLPSERTSPVVWLELMTRERFTPWRPRAAVVARRWPSTSRRLLHWVNLRHERFVPTSPLNPNLPPLLTHPQAATERHRAAIYRAF